MPLIPFKAEDLPLYLKHDFIRLGPGGRFVFVHECIYCGAVFDMPSAADERCREREKLVRNWGDPFRIEPTH
jgi:hypothetical protein